MFGLATAGFGIGAIVTPALIAGLGVRGALVVTGVFLPALVFPLFFRVVLRRHAMLSNVLVMYAPFDRLSREGSKERGVRYEYPKLPADETILVRRLAVSYP